MKSYKNLSQSQELRLSHFWLSLASCFRIYGAERGT